MTNFSSQAAPTDVAFLVARQASVDAGAVLLEGFGADPSAPLLGRHQRPDVKSSDIDLVTEFDRRSETLVVERLRAAFADDVILAEESSFLEGAKGGSPLPPGSARWLIDPLDGTTNFAHGQPFFCVSIAREVDGRIDVAVVNAPALGLVFCATAGGGATLNGKRLRVSEESELGRSMLATGFPYDRHTSADNNFAQFVAFQKRVQAVRRFGSAALDLCLVASGHFDGYWEMKLKPWDMAAGALMVLEAGGRLTGWLGEPYSVDKGAAVASNGRIHEAMLAVIAGLDIPAAAL